MNAKDWSPSEAIFAFMGSLTTRREPIVLGAAHDAAPAVQAITEFCERHKLDEPRLGWETAIVAKPAHS